MTDTVLVLDFGAQYAQLIARRVREASVYSEIVPHSISIEEIQRRSPVALVFSGGPKSVNIDDAPAVDPKIYDLGIPIFGICYGAQLIARDLGGVVEPTGVAEYGRTELTVVPSESELLGTDSTQSVWMSHFDSISTPPDGFEVLASTPGAHTAAFASLERKIVGVQYHPEVAHTPAGQALFRRFLHDVASIGSNWTMEHYITEATKTIRNQVGDGRAICGLSGGVDSAVAAALVHQAIGDQLTCVFVDTGLMSKEEGAQVVETFGRHQGIELIHVDASDKFFAELNGVTDPEEKRKIIGRLFVEVFEDASSHIENADFLVQGTLYPDVIESGTTHAAKIKSHHNVGGLPDDLKFDLVEPLRSLFKDEVRAVGTQLGLPDEIVWRQPFPGPGLGVRIIGEVTREKVQLLQEADFVVRDELTNAGLDREIWQSFAVLADIRSVGVMGDERTYGHPIIVRAVTSEDAMTADWARIDYDVLEKISSRIISHVPGINRVCYDITSKPPGTIEWE